ncbi:MAG: PD-(D/E)XK nuclease family protein [Oscillospiraceae bacterium]|nr:PD-(D/E)XK nuclease family protein [Oscillospiraceae bacterium]
MLTLNYSPSPRANAAAAIASICALPEEKRCVLIVPEQNSFDTEWALCQAGGDSISRRAEVLSFSRLATRVFSITGGIAKPMLDKSGRMIAMAGALELLRPKLRLYGVYISKPEFLKQLLQIVDEFHAYGLEASAIRKAREALPEALSDKLEELCLVLELYDTVCARASLDPSTQLDRLRDALYDSDYARNLQIVVSGFTDFTNQELAVLEALCRGGAELTVWLCCDSLRDGQTVFSVPRRTAAALRDMARRIGMHCHDAAQPVPSEPGALEHLTRFLFSPRTKPWEVETDRVLLLPATDAAEECALAVGRIQALIRGGARWRDIGVAYSDASVFEATLERLLDRFEMPVYFSGNRTIMRHGVIRAVVFALEAAAFGMETETVCDYLHSGYAPLSLAEADRLENYAIVWKLRSKRWDQPFDKNPSGPVLEQLSDEELEARVAPLNQARARAIVPLLRLRSALRDASDTAGQVQSLDRFLEEIGLEQAVTKAASMLSAAGDMQRARELTQLYEILLTTMEQIYGVLGAGHRSPEDFCRFFQAALTQNSVSTIPATVDCLRVGDLSAMRNTRIKHLIVLGASDGLLPSWESGGSLLSDDERRRMKAAGLSTAPDAEDRLDRDLLTAYTVFSAATETICLCCDRTAPSYLFTRLQNLFPARIEARDLPLPQTEQEAAFLAVRSGEGGASLLQEIPSLVPYAELVRARAAYEPGSLDHGAVANLYGDSLSFSASKVDRLAACKFGFFLQYGLHLQERKEARVDPAIYGTLVHYVLQHTAEQVEEEGGFASVSEERVQTLARVWYDRFVEEYLGGLADYTNRSAYLLERSFLEIAHVVRDMTRELAQSRFIPTYFELAFRDQTAIPITGDLAVGSLNGVVDRVDLYTTASGKTYLRVVDYKTGQKDFDYTDILSGMGLQMLIYLFALTQEAARYYHRELLPAGVLYFPARYNVESAKNRLSEEEAEHLHSKKLQRQGLLLDDDEILQAMEPGTKPVYLPYKLSPKRTGDLASAEQLSLVEGHVRRTLGKLADSVWSGVIAPDPFWRGDKHNACRWCPYRSVCRVDSGEVPLRRLRSVSRDEFWKEIEQEADNNGR